MPSPDHRTPPPRLPGDLIVRLVEAHQHGSLHLPVFHADDVLPLLDGSDREIAAAAVLLAENRVFYPRT
ncbi:hypothetical protein LTV02_34900 [Nocardia yamanashiensis]|uniref:hypothetical protein n=1 Tax=Nocardia yamanashiensis TaxID=209247 RepID=UPI001E3744A2|nr:hypothetical protein [Nocardia yamanashiensis]UGT41087.1 hypothetical protein LTV02_34900 [Nocardia yamanashiensis]